MEAQKFKLKSLRREYERYEMFTSKTVGIKWVTRQSTNTVMRLIASEQGW
jgi:hypothetical protein